MPIAAMGRRLGAFLIDAMIYGIIMSIFVNEKAAGWWSRNLAIVAGTLVWITYEALMLAARGQTVGKILLKIRVVSADGSPISRNRAWLRAIMRTILSPVWALDLGVAFFTEHRATLHDIVANTRVIRIAR